MKALTVTTNGANRILSGVQTIHTTVTKLTVPEVEPGEQLALWRPSPHTHPYDMKGHIVGTATVTATLPIIDPSGDDDDIWPCMYHDVSHGRLWVHGADSDDIWLDEQLPFGDFSPGRWGWMLTDPQPITEPCPRRAREDDPPQITAEYLAKCSRYPTMSALQAARRSRVCITCRGTGRVPADPVPCKGQQGVFELPADVAKQINS